MWREKSLGILYTDFDSAFALWLKDWEDPERSASVEYFGTLDGMLAAASVLLERRRAELQAPDGQFSTVESSAPLAEDAQALAAQIRETTPPASLQEIHQDAVSYFDVMAKWLNLELEYAQNRVDAVRVEANALIPEGSARELLLRQDIGDSKFVLNVLD